MIRYGLIAAALCGCAKPGPPPISSGPNPAAHEVYLIAFAPQGSGHVVLERELRDRLRLSIAALDPKTSALTRLGTDDDALLGRLTERWPDRAHLAAALQGSLTAATIEALGYTWPQLVAGDRLELEIGSASVADDGRILLKSGDAEIDLVSSPDDRQPSTVSWLRAIDNRAFAVELTYPGEPSVRALHVFSTDVQLARLLATRAYQAHQAKKYAVASRLWERAVALDPEASASWYNLACAEARQGFRQDAVEHLARAIDTGGDRYRRLARRDSDLRTLRSHPDFQFVVYRR